MVDRLCEQLVYERRAACGSPSSPTTATTRPAVRGVTFDHDLQEAGYRVADHLQGPRDVVIPSFGLITYAAFYTADPAGVAAVLLPNPVTTVACYPQATP